MSEITILLGKQLKALRFEHDITQEQLAELADLNVTYIGQLERGQKSPTLDTLEKLANAFNITLPTLLTFSHQKECASIHEEQLDKLLFEYSKKIQALYSNKL